MKRVIALIMSVFVFCTFSGCSDSSGTTTEHLTASSADKTTLSETANFDYVSNDSDMFSDRDISAEYSDTCVTIQLNGDTAVSSSASVKINGSTITITEEATYIISGTLTDGMIIINADENAKPQLVLSNASITSESSAALYILEADKVFVTLEDNTSNSLSNGGTFTAIDENNIDATVFSKKDLTFNGNGSLEISSPADHGIVCKDDLVIAGGSYTINSASHGIDANDSIRIKSSELEICSGKDGIHCENSDDTSLGYIYISGGAFNIEAEGDGISASAFIQIKDGNFDILTGGGAVNGTKKSSDSWGGFMGGKGEKKPSDTSTSSTDSSTSIKAIKAATGILISNGKFTIDSADDAIHSNGSVVINGGVFEIATGDDGFHADEALTITNGTINISESYEGLEALNIKIQGGNIDLISDDDGLNAAGGNDSSGMSGGRDAMFGGGGMQLSNGTIVISGGTMCINASGDGIDANGTLEINGGYTTVCGPTVGDTATLDYDKSAVITGGTFIGTGASGMAQTFSDSEQGVIALNVGNQSASTMVSIKNSNNETIISFAPELSFSVIIVSSPDLISDKQYTVEIGSYSNEFAAS